MRSQPASLQNGGQPGTETTITSTLSDRPAVTLSERLNTPISTAELERRWSLARKAMEEAQIDVLLIHCRTAESSGYVRWFIDMPSGWVPVTVIFPRDDDMTVVMHGNVGGDIPIPPEGDGYLRGVKRILTHPYFASIYYTRAPEAALTIQALALYERGTIGLLSASRLALSVGEQIKRDLPNATFVGAEELIDPLKAIKSPEEQQLIRATALVQDKIMEQTLRAVEPGKRESDVIAVARRAARELGSEGSGMYMAGAGPVGEPTSITIEHMQHRVLREGDVLSLLIEADGPGGLFTELGRMCVLGEVPAELDEEYEFATRAQQFTVDLLKPGANCSEVWEAYNEFMRSNGRGEERRLHAHSQGYDMVERPLIRFDETMAVEAGMNFACHPCYAHGGVMWWVCDNWLIGPEGPGDRLHAFPQEIVVL